MKEISLWGNMWIMMAYKFCPQYFGYFADHICLIEINNTERLKRLRVVHKHRDPQELAELEIKYSDWFELNEKLWLYGTKQDLHTGYERFAKKKVEWNSDW